MHEESLCFMPHERFVMMRLLLVLAVTGALVGAGCRGMQEVENDPPPRPEDVIEDLGTVRHVELEGGFYGIVADDGTRYLPDSLDEAYREDGLRVRFRAEEREGAMTTQMWGTPVTILEIMRLEE